MKLAGVQVEIVNVRDRRTALDPPPFIDDKRLWARAVERFLAARRRGQLPGEPFLVVTALYRELGGDFR